MNELSSPFDAWLLGAEIEDPVNPLNASHLAHVCHGVVCQENTSMHLKVLFSVKGFTHDGKIPTRTRTSCGTA